MSAAPSVQQALDFTDTHHDAAQASVRDYLERCPRCGLLLTAHPSECPADPPPRFTVTR